MNRLTFWTLLLLCVAVEVWGLVTDRRDVHYAGVIAAVGVIAVARLLFLARQDKEGQQ
ncbi:hypothetical protein ACFXA4_26485 [Streptomyces sp. NPDC059442]|uniref:hypothetical protein n=1 Tax=Streptomyces sp. NPDC059442 TaxID=3346830 RepID=UPI0036CE60C2